MRILIVDDDRLNCISMEQLLVDAGHTPIAFTTASDALEALQRARFDIAVVDLYIPGMNGLEFLRKAKAEFPIVVFVMMSPHWTRQSQDEAIRCGAQAVLTKPFDIERLKRVLKAS